MHAFSMGLHRRASDSPVQVLSKEYVNKIFNVKRATTDYERSIDEIVNVQCMVLNREASIKFSSAGRRSRGGGDVCKQF
jgi:hypothetical protein